MDPEMQQKCEKKLRELKECMPFLLKVLEKLRNNNRIDPARQTQLEKIQKLYNLLNDKSQTFKWELLVKCENVIKKLQRKMELQEKQTLSSPVEEKKEKGKNSEEEVEELNCPESPPPQDDIDAFETIQPVVIPTERRSSPPVSRRPTESYNTIRANKSERNHHKIGHTHNHHKHHNPQVIERNHSRHYQHKKERERSPTESSKKHGFKNRNTYDSQLSSNIEKNEQREIARYPAEHRKRDKDNRQNIWQRRVQSSEKYEPEEVWEDYSNEQYSREENHTPTRCGTNVNNYKSNPSSGGKQPIQNKFQDSVFDRLGQKFIDCDSVSQKEKVFDTFQVNVKNKSQFNSLNSSSPTLIAKEIDSPIVSDFLKSPPLSATDITLLLNESNSNSNTSDCRSISQIGSRRENPTVFISSKSPMNTNSPDKSKLDIVRRKFAMLTKNDASAMNSTLKNEIALPNTSLTSPKTNTSTQIATTPTINNQISPPLLSGERVALKYHPHPRSASIQSNSSNDGSVIMPNPNVNVLPTLRPNDPRLRKSNQTVPATESRNIMSPQPNVPMSPSTPSPIYGSILKTHTTSIPVAPINDPRLQHGRTQSSLEPVSNQKRSLLVQCDSSDENWDLDDNVGQTVFPKPRPFSNETQTRTSERVSHQILEKRRNSLVWDSGFQPTMPVITQQNNLINNNNFPNTSESIPFHNTNWPGGHVPLMSLQINSTGPGKPFDSDRFNTFQNNNPNYFVPRTYGAYKEAKARAAAEEAARREAEEAKARKTRIETEQKDNETTPNVNSNLDTMYRGTNIANCEHPKPINNFKIPKKSPESPDSEVLNKAKTKQLENKDDVVIPQKANDKLVKKTADVSIDSESSKGTELKITDLKPKPQRSKFIGKNRDQTKPMTECKNSKHESSLSDLEKPDVITDSDSFENIEWHVLDEVVGSDLETDSVKTEKSKQTKSPVTPLKHKILENQPGRILTRRCTMVDHTSTPEVDKKILFKNSAMLFEDLQERERKKQFEEAKKVPVNIRRHVGEICYEKTDDGCTVSTQNIITGKRRTRTTANFNEVQQGIAVFKHLKSNDQKKDTSPASKIVNSPSKERKKPGPKPKMKQDKKIEWEKDGVGGKKSGRKRQKTLGDSDGEKIKEEEQCEKLSDTLPNVYSIIDTFIQKILNTSTNADELINKLRDILSEQEVEALLSVREAMLKKQKKTGEDEKCDSKSTDDKIKNETPKSEDDEKKLPEICALETKEEPKTQTGTSHTRPKGARRNELDRLHEDIRDMFISEGVLTATGKRMCTFVEPSNSKATECDQKNKDGTDSVQNMSVTRGLDSPTPLKQKTPVSLQVRGRKSRELLPSSKVERASVRRSLRKTQSTQNLEETQEEEVDDSVAPCETSFSSDVTQFSSKSEDTTSSFSTVNTLTSTSSYTTSEKEPLRRMPVLKPVTPVRLPEEDELEKWLAKEKESIGGPETALKIEKSKPKKYKPCPKSKKPPNAFLDCDDEDHVVLEDSTKNSDITCESLQIKTEILDVTVPYEDINIKSKESKFIPMNVNPKWHWASRYAHKCVVCKQKCSYMSAHYKKCHSENYASRVAPLILHQLKQENSSLSKASLKLDSKGTSLKACWLHRCPFCLQFKYTSFAGWLEHFITHTGEYFYECTKCHKSYNKPQLIERHMKEKCAELGGRYLHNDEFKRSFKHNQINAHVCHLCNYIRLGRDSLERHYMQQHEYDVKSINASTGYTICLINGKDVPLAKTLEELDEMVGKLNGQYQSGIISLSDDEKDDEMIEKDKDKLTDKIVGIGKPEENKDNQINKKEKVPVPEKTDQIKKGVGKRLVKTVKSGLGFPTSTSSENATSKISERTNTQEKMEVYPSPLNINTDSNLKAHTPVGTKVSETVSSVFVSTTDDSNDKDGPTVLARKLFTVDDEADICNKGSPRPGSFGIISMAERLSQRLKNAEAKTASNIAEQQKQLKSSDEAISISSHQQKEKEDEATQATDPQSKPKKSSEEIIPVTDSHTEQGNMNQAESKTESPKRSSRDTLSTSGLDEKCDEGEIDLTLEEDDEEWEDIEIVETGPSNTTNSFSVFNNVAKDSKIQKSKNNPLQKLSRFYGNSKSHKKTKNFKPLMTLLSGVNSTNKDSNQRKEIAKAPTKPTTSSPTPTATPPTTTTTSSLTKPNTQFTPALVIGFRPMIANLADLLPDSPCNDPIEIVPELAPSGPLQELNDITSFLGSNLSGPMDIEVEDPSNSICIHNYDNQETSIHEALNFEISQTENYNETQTLTESLGPNEDCLTIATMTIQNIGYTCSTAAKTNSTQISPTTYRFYCLSDRCTFLYSSEAIGLENHFLLEHPQAKWSGHCKTCNRQVKVSTTSSDLKFSDEFNHLVEVHIKPSNSTMDLPTIGVEATQEFNDDNNEPPRIKLRRLSGDCLSTASIQSESHSSNLTEANCDSNSLSDLIRFNQRTTTPTIMTPANDQFTEIHIPTTVECVSNDVPLFTNVSKDFQITSISSGLEPTELSSIVKSALNGEGHFKQTDPTNKNSFTLQISNVVSLGEKSNTGISDTESHPMMLPKITNVCSLSGSSSATQRTAELWPQQLNDELVEPSQSAAECIEVSRILENSQLDLNPFTTSTNLPHRLINDSPGPTVVSETLPVGQATNGDFLLTQTVSAQYPDETAIDGGVKNPKLGFNISISSTTNAKAITSSTNSGSSSQFPKPTFNCMEIGCKYATRHFVAIIDHIKMHEKKNDTPHGEYLRCSLCRRKLNNVDAYTKHLRLKHYPDANSPTMPSLESTPDNPQSTTPIENVPVSKTNTTVTPLPTCPLAEKIRSILNHNQVEITSKENNIEGKKRSSPSSTNIQVPEGPEQKVDEESIAYKARLTETIKEMVSKTGICENKIFRCSVKDCNVKLNETTYHTHVVYHLTTLGGMHTVFPCPHCKSKFTNISALKTHIKNHGRHKMFCYLCMETAASEPQLARHFNEKHRQKERLKTSVLLQCENNDDTFPVYLVSNSSPLSESDVNEFGKKLIIEWQRKKAATRTHFNPDEIDLLPIQAIFSKEIYCALCLYKTKVRTNMVRHMHQHRNTTNSVCGSTNAFGQNQRDGDTNDNAGNMVSSMDPVNPVPCLISNEKHFDRMTNLASSSLVTQSGNSTSSTNTNSSAPSVGCKLRFSYIPQSKRFICGVLGCQYLTISEDIFRSHLNALHSDANFYQCLFCKEELCKRSLVVERILQHLRFHDRTMFQCEQCEYNHYIRHVVDRHALEKHGIVARANVLMFVRDEEGALEGNKKVLIAFGKKTKDNKKSGEVPKIGQNGSSGISAQKNTGSGVINVAKSAQKFPKYICDLCGHKTVTFNQQVAHSNAQHSIKKPYQCPYCLYFTDWNEQNIITHIADKHPGEELRATRIFGKMSAKQQMETKKDWPMKPNKSGMSELPPKPLWQRDDPKRARQIRGIPMEDEEDSERLRKRLRLSEDYEDEDDLESYGASGSTNSLGQSESKLFLNRFEFGCFHCEYKTSSIDDLKKTHWESSHNHVDGPSSKPFLFRLLISLKCAECQEFIGCFWELQKHMDKNHAMPTCHAADPRAKKLTCGYCDYDCASPAQMVRHHLRESHQPQDIKGLSFVEKVKVMRLECSSPTVFVHCLLCSELFNSRLAVVHHAGEKHGDETEHFSFRELRNKTIYRCSECLYSSTNELTTLRHMINHYSKFKICIFCNQAQTTFNGYMQHCYSDHRMEIRRFSEIYPLHDIQKYLMQMLIIFPNGWVINKKNLRNTTFGNEEHIKTLYTEICKTSQEPPIPRLSLGRLVARKSIEAKQQHHHQEEHQEEQQVELSVLQLAENEVIDSKKKTTSAQKITKRRSTVAIGNVETNISAKHSFGNKKHKLSPHIPESQPISMPSKMESVTTPETPSPEPFSFYGQKPEKENWSNLHTKICIAGVNTKISLDKFKILVRIDAKVVVEKLDIQKYNLSKCLEKKEHEKDNDTCETNSYNNNNFDQYRHVKKACPASQKYRFT